MDGSPAATAGGGAGGGPPTPQPIVIREKAKRGARACIQCRKLKKTCEGGSAPCVRCKASGAQCVFDKPASSVVEDAGLSRLAAIEAALATNERRMDTVVQQMGEVSNVLSEVLRRLQPSGSQLASPTSLPYPPTQVSPYATNGPFDPSSSGSSQPTPPAFAPFGRPPPPPPNSTSTYSPGFQPLPNLPTFPTPPSSSALPNPPASFGSTTSPPTSGTGNAPKPPDYPSGLDALASLASSNSPDVHRFASRMGQPISALADAVAQLNGEHGEGGEQKPDVRDGGNGEGRTGGAGGMKTAENGREGQDGGREGGEGGEPPAKRSKLNGSGGSGGSGGMGGGAGGAGVGAAPSAGPNSTPDQFDLVAKGLMSDQDARALVLLWMKECQPFCSVLDPSADTYESLRRRSPFLFNVVVYTALRAQERNAPPSKELLAAAEETRRFAQNQVFRTPTLEDVQAVFVMACYHQEPYILSGMGLRLALSGRFETTWDQIEAHGIAKTDEKARRLTAQLRTWTYVLQLEYKHSRYSGRKIIVLREDLDKAISQADRLLTLPFAISSDVRHVANLRLVGIERQIMCETASMSPSSDENIAQQAAYVHDKAAKLLEWHSHYDSIIAGFEPSPLAWPRKSHTRMWHDANLFLVANTFKQRLLDRPSTASPELNQIAQGALSHARANLLTVLGSPVYREGARWSGYLLRVDLSFAAIFLLKSAAAYPQLVDRDEVAKDVGQLADLLAGTAGSQRYSATLRVARDQYLARTGAPPTPADSSSSSSAAATAAAAAVSAAMTAASNPPSLRSILASHQQHLPPTLSAPLSAFGPSGLPAFASAPSSSAAAAGLNITSDGSTSLAPPSFPLTTSTPAPSSSSAAASAAMAADTAPLPAVNSGKALLPGELDFDFGSLAASMPQSLFDDPGVLLRQDWTAVGELPANWPEWT